ncbi:hypothetical protein TNCV_5013441 [Trichonephila clavipes]|nr:hypothetical protein TNCV_5013441 [Trichonephila clavipes]
MHRSLRLKLDQNVGSQLKNSKNLSQWTVVFITLLLSSLDLTPFLMESEKYTDTIVKLKTKIENSSTFESDPDFVKTLIQNCIDERVSRNEREVTLGKQKIELAKLQLAKLEKEVELQRVKNKALSLNPAAKVEEKQFETLNKETATHIGIREAEDWFRPIDFAKSVIFIFHLEADHIKKFLMDIPKTPLKIDHKTLNQRLKRTIPNILKEKIKIALYAVIHLIAQETVRSVLNLKNLTTTSIIE